jgi:proteasome beta subunit
MSMLPGTVIGIRARDGVVLASEKRLTYNGFVLSKNIRKLHPITKHIGVGFAGLIGDMQFLVKLLRYEAKNYEIQHYREIKVRSLAKVLSLILYSYKLMPLFNEVVVGGVDKKGPQIYVLDPMGSLIEDKYAALGSGGPIALGIIESMYRDDISIGDAKELAVKALKEAIERDTVSGDGIDLLIITSEGYKTEEILFSEKA